MLIQVSCGEVIDKLTILELKYDKIRKNDYGMDETLGAEKMRNIENEFYEIKNSSQINVEDYGYQYKLLKHTNAFIMESLDLINYKEQYFQMENAMKSLNDLLIQGEPVDSEKNYNIISKEIVKYNDIRYNIKNWINKISNSTIIEEKTYNATFCKIVIENKAEFYEKLPEINDILIRHNNILIEVGKEPENQSHKCRKDSIEYPFLQILNHPSIYLSEQPENDNYTNIHGRTLNNNEIRLSKTIYIKEYSLSPSIRKIFEYPTISYIGCGMFGDYIQQLSIICELYYMTGRKGDLYISSLRERFHKGVDFTYNDTYRVLMQQKYINDYKKHEDNQNIKIDIDLSRWRNSPLLYRDGWNEIFKSEFNINWGFHKWINVDKNDKWKNTIFINITNRGTFINNYDEFYHSVYTKFGNKYNISFISPDIETIEHFKNLCPDDIVNNIEWYSPRNFNDMCTAINSCHLLIGSLSGVLAIGHACHIPRYILLVNDVPLEFGDNFHNYKFNQYWDNVVYTLEDAQ
jgi:hypothetical protein